MDLRSDYRVTADSSRMRNLLHDAACTVLRDMNLLDGYRRRGGRGGGGGGLILMHCCFALLITVRNH